MISVGTFPPITAKQDVVGGPNYVRKLIYMEKLLKRQLWTLNLKQFFWLLLKMYAQIFYTKAYFVIKQKFDGSNEGYFSQ